MRLRAWILLLLMATLPACNEGSSGGIGPEQRPDTGSRVFRLDLGQAGSQRVDVLVVNPSADGAPMEVAFDTEPAPAGPAAAKPAESGRDLPRVIYEAEMQQIDRCLQSRGQYRSELGRGERARFQQLAPGSTLDFFIATTGSSVTCQKLLDESQTVHCVVMGELVAGQPVVSQQTALDIARAFDSDNPFRPGSGIYDQVRAAFGSEWNSNPPGGRDGDSKVVLVLLSSRTIGGSTFFGFFRPSDEFSRAEIGSSNEGEILYVNVEVEPFDYLATMAHEFQHMVRFNQKFLRNGAFDGTREEGTLDEGCAVNAEEICGYSLTAAGGGNSFMFGACESYLESAGGTNLFDFNGSFQFYGGGYLLVRYFREHFGEDAFRTFNMNTGTGYQNMVEVSGLTGGELFRRFSLALLTSGFTGPVPDEGRFPSGFSTVGTFEIRGMGTVALPGLQPVQTSSQLSSLSVPAFAPVLLRLEGASSPVVVAGSAAGD
ncbi:MAG: hypothetical protein AB1758_33235, partial [Candidatus Eremiobacterota bacterium]